MKTRDVKKGVTYLTRGRGRKLVRVEVVDQKSPRKIDGFPRPPIVFQVKVEGSSSDAEFWRSARELRPAAQLPVSHNVLEGKTYDQLLALLAHIRHIVNEPDDVCENIPRDTHSAESDACTERDLNKYDMIAQLVIDPDSEAENATQDHIDATRSGDGTDEPTCPDCERHVDRCVCEDRDEG